MTVRQSGLMCIECHRGIMDSAISSAAAPYLLPCVHVIVANRKADFIFDSSGQRNAVSSKPMESNSHHDAILSSPVDIRALLTVVCPSMILTRFHYRHIQRVQYTARCKSIVEKPPRQSLVSKSYTNDQCIMMITCELLTHGGFR